MNIRINSMNQEATIPHKDINLKSVSDKKEFTFFGLRSKFSPILLQITADVFAITLSYFIHYYLRFHTQLFGSVNKQDLSIIISTGLIFLIYWILIFWLSGLYKNWFVRSPFDELFTVIKVSFAGSFLIFFFVLLDSSKSPRLLFLIYFALIVVFVASGRFVARKLQKKFREKRIVIIPSLIIGSQVLAKDLYNRIIKSPSWGYKVNGFIHLDNSSNNNKYLDENNEVPILGNIQDFEKIINKYKIDEIIITAESPKHSLLLKIVTLCAEKRISVKIVPDL